MRPCSIARACKTALRHRIRLIWVQAIGSPLRSCAAATTPAIVTANVGRSAGFTSCIAHRGGSGNGTGTRLSCSSAHVRAVATRASGGSAPSEETGGYWTLQSYVLYESEVKKSKFMVHAWPVSSAPEALSLITAASDLSASHNCFAYRVGDEFRSSDDGEPGGTAGRPIQAALDGEGLDRVAVLVTRYFGGMKLGAGGLVRAYGGAAKECLKLAPRVFAKAQSEVVVEVPYDELGVVYGCLDMHGCTRLAEEYGNSGTVALRALVDADRLTSLRAAVADGTGGRRRVELAAAGDSAAANAVAGK